MKQLAAARAVIVLWTQNSIKSDFVRAEAGRAKADGKLIPVKESDVATRISRCRSTAYHGPSLCSWSATAVIVVLWSGGSIMLPIA